MTWRQLAVSSWLCHCNICIATDHKRKTCWHAYLYSCTELHSSTTAVAGSMVVSNKADPLFRSICKLEKLTDCLRVTYCMSPQRSHSCFSPFPLFFTNSQLPLKIPLRGYFCYHLILWKKCRQDFTKNTVFTWCWQKRSSNECQMDVKMFLCFWVCVLRCLCLGLCESEWWSGSLLHFNYNVDRWRKSPTEAMIFIVYYKQDGVFLSFLSICLFLYISIFLSLHDIYFIITLAIVVFISSTS